MDRDKEQRVNVSGLTDQTLRICEWRGKIISAHAKINGKGGTILLKYLLKFEMGSTNIDSEGRFILVKVKINNLAFVMGSVYARVIDEPTF